MQNFQKLVELRLLSRREELMARPVAELPGSMRRNARWPSKTNTVVKKTKEERRAQANELLRVYGVNLTAGRQAARAGDWATFHRAALALPRSYRKRLHDWCRAREIEVPS